MIRFMAATSLAGSPEPDPAPPATRALAVAADLVEHAFAIDADETMENADNIMQHAPHEYAAVISKGVVVGTCSRALLRRLVGGQYGFALHARHLVRRHVYAVHHAFNANAPLREVLDIALARQDDDFYHDVVIVDDDHHLVGLVSTLRLVREQSRLMADQYLIRDQQRAELERVNGSLRDSLELQRALEHQMVQEAKSALMRSLAGGIAHEINNKLVPIMGYAELMAQQAAAWRDHELEEYCGVVRTCALESAQIIRQLLELSKPTAPALVSLDLREAITQAMTFTQLRIRESDTSFELDLPAREVVVLADPTQIKQLIVNLVLNAIDAMVGVAERRLSVQLTVSGETARLAVRDSGSGIPADRIGRIFDPFFTTKRSEKGTGLGLAVCSAVARQHDGDIFVESTVGQGSTFTVSLPLGRSADRALASSVPENVAGVPSIDLRGIPALVADDEVGSGQFVKRALEKALGLDVTWVADGEAAVRHIETKDYALIVSDMRMPKLDGIELLAWVGVHRPAMASRMLFITGDASADKYEAAKRAGVRVLLKPFKVEALTSECRSIAAAYLGAAEA
jgi:signal transduction histidine kinase/CheY-like chemotaxis protein